MLRVSPFVVALVLLSASCASVAPAEDAPGGEAPTTPTSPVAPPSDEDAGEAEQAEAEPSSGDESPSDESPSDDAETGEPASATSGEGEPAPAKVVVGDSFEIAVPSGFREVDPSEPLAADNGLMMDTFSSGGVVMLQEAAQEGAERRGVILARGPQPVDEAAFDQGSCARLAQKMGNRAHATLVAPPAVVDLPAGPACGFSLVDSAGVVIDNLFVNLDGRSFRLQAIHEQVEVATPKAFQAAASTWSVRGELRARGRGFSIPVPQGFRLADGEERKKAAEAGAALVVAAQHPDVPKGRRAAIWVQPITDPPGRWDRVRACQELAESIVAGRGEGAQAERVDVVRFDFGHTCRVQIASPEQSLVRTITIPVYRGPEVWVISCTVDVRDPLGREACQEVAEGLLPD